MGNIRPSFVKIRAIRLCEEYPDQFCPSESHQVCTCDHVQQCEKCGHVMSNNSEREQCEFVEVKTSKDGKKKKYIECKSDKFSEPYLPHATPFDHNKKQVERFTDLVDADGQLANKRIRNWIAGYITRYKQRRVD